MKKLLIFLFVITLFVFIQPISVKADMGPKPTIHIKIEGIQGNYTAALAAQEAYGPNHPFNEHAEEYDNYHPIMRYKDDEGFFWITKYKQMQNSDTFSFTYYPPSPFKLIVMLEDGTTLVSQKYERYAFESLYIVHVDVTSATLILNTDTNHTDMTLKIIIRLMITLFIELIILLLFNIKSKHAIVVFLMINVFTQLFLNISLSMYDYFNGILVAFAYYFLIEIIILFIESFLYIKFIQDESKKKLLLYSLIANFFSFVAGMILFINF